MNRKSILTLFVTLLILCAIILAAYLIFNGRGKKEPEGLKSDNNYSWIEEKDRLTEKIALLEREIEKTKGAEQEIIPTEEPLKDDPFSPSAENLDDSVSLDETERRIAAFFIHLEEQDYFREYELKKSAYSEYESAVQALSLKTPIIAGETESLYNLFLNIAHLYRTLGPERLRLIRDVIQRESSQIEPLMRSFFIWYTLEHETEQKIKGIPSMEVMYEYASFLLNTIGGRSYLLRRDSNIRILVTYYSVLILDRSNDIKINSHGIDIRPFIDNLLNDMNSYTGLEYRDLYIRRLSELAEKYQR